MMAGDYLILGPGMRQKRRYCVRCHTPLPFEPDIVRHMIVRAGGTDTTWLVRRCRNPACTTSNLQAADDESDIEREMNVDC